MAVKLAKLKCLHLFLCLHSWVKRLQKKLMAMLSYNVLRGMLSSWLQWRVKYNLTASDATFIRVKCNPAVPHPTPPPRSDMPLLKKH
jgi:hypothetical protein